VNGSLGPSGYQTTNQTSNTSDSYLFAVYARQVYPGTFNLPESSLELTPHSVYTTSGPDDLVKIRLFNVSASKQYNMYNIMANTTSGTGGLRVYYCNSSYTSGNIIASPDCDNFYTVLAGTPYNYSHGPYSSHVVIPFAINTTTGQMGTVKVTSTSYFVLRGIAGTNWDVYYISDVSRPDTIQTSSDAGAAWSDFSGTVDSHLNQYDGTDALYYYACANDTLWNANCSSVRFDLIDLSGIPPTPPIIYHPNASSYCDNISINYTAAVSPNGYSITYTTSR
jgi:hypothetical protein